jgi:hypothetical protein
LTGRCAVVKVAAMRGMSIAIITIAISAAACPARADTGAHEVAFTGCYSFYPYPSSDRGPAAGLGYTWYFIQDLGLKARGLASWLRPRQQDNAYAPDHSLAFQGALGLNYVVDTDIVEPIAGAGMEVTLGGLGQGNTWVLGGYLGAGIAYNVKPPLRIALGLTYHYPFNGRESLPPYLMLELEVILFFGEPSETLSRI